MSDRIQCLLKQAAASLAPSLNVCPEFDDVFRFNQKLLLSTPAAF